MEQLAFEGSRPGYKTQVTPKCFKYTRSYAVKSSRPDNICISSMPGSGGLSRPPSVAGHFFIVFLQFSVPDAKQAAEKCVKGPILSSRAHCAKDLPEWVGA